MNVLYTTSDLGLAVSLAIKGVNPSKLTPIAYNKVEFVYESEDKNFFLVENLYGTKDFQVDLFKEASEYYKGGMKVDPRKFISEMGNLKARVHELLDRNK